MVLDLLWNQNPNSSLGPFDGEVAALAQLGADHYFITTHTNYVPAVPSLQLPHALFLRSDMRYGMDDPTLWPQQWTARYCHLPVIAKKGSCTEIGVMWWDPAPADFIVGSAVTRGLGRLHYKQLQRTSQTPISPLFSELINIILMWTEQLQTLPTTYSKMVFAVTSLQRAFLELDALYNYTTVYKLRIDNYMSAPSPDTPITQCVGAFTTVPAVAQQLWTAHLPFWFLRPTYVFDAENILAVVPLSEPVFIVPDAPGDGAPPIVYSGNSTSEKIAAIHRAAVQTPWYRNPFETVDTRSRSLSPPPSTEPSAAIPIAATSRPIPPSNNQQSRFKPYPPKAPGKASAKGGKAPAKGPAKTQWDKFSALAVAEMPPSIVAWADALVQVDQSVTPFTSDPADKQYVLPEPAILVNTTPERRRKFLHHWTLLRDSFIYMLSQPQHVQLLSAQEWRDILEGHLTKRGHPSSRTYRRSAQLEDRLRPALEASNVSSVEGFPVPLEFLPEFSVERTREIVWQVAEASFRFEFSSLDRRASKKHRLDEVKACFAGHMLIAPLEMSKCGWAATAIEERHRYVVRAANLMLDWTTKSLRPNIIHRVAEHLLWTPSAMQELETAVCCYYTQAFWEYFGRAAVVPPPAAELLCPQCWLNKHRTMPTHWAFIWNTKEHFFEKYDFCRVLKNVTIGLGHHGQRCPEADLGRTFTLVESNGIHATVISFCRCKTADGQRGEPEFQQLLRAGIFPGSVKEPKTGYTLGLLEYYRQQRNQGKGSAYNFVQVLQRMADPFFAGAVPDIYINFLAITRFHQHLDIIMRRGHAHGLDVALPGEPNRLYPNRPIGYLGLQCAACPERGVNMPLLVNVPKYLRHLISQHYTLDGNFKANLFFKHDDGSDVALTDGKMYFPSQKEFEGIAKTYIVSEEDKEVPCKAHIGSIRHQGQVKYGNTAVSGVVACACDHAILGSFVDMIKGEAFALGTYAQREHLKHTNSPPHGPETTTPTVFSYNSWCSFVVNLVQRAITVFPEETGLLTLLAEVEGQIPADHILGHGIDCQAVCQAVYFACRSHFHGETAEMLWAFLNPLGSSTRQMTGAARHDIINFVMDAWNTLKVLRQAQLLADERLNALRLFGLHMAVVEDLSRQHATEVVAWSWLSRKTTKSSDGALRSVYQHESTTVLTIENVLASMVAEEREKMAHEDGHEARTPVAEWIHDGMNIERQQVLVIALLESHREHPLQYTWTTITKLCDSLNLDLKKFRECQRDIYPRLKLSGLDVDEPELTAIQLPSYRMKHGQQVANEDSELQAAETKLRCSEANSGILAVRAASLALSAVKKARDLDYWGQAGITRSQRNLQKAELMKSFEITMYNRARAALIHLGHMARDAVELGLAIIRWDSLVFTEQGDSIARAAVASTLSPSIRDGDREDDEPHLLAGTQTLKRSGGTAAPSYRVSKKSPHKPKRLKDIAPDDVVVESSSSEAEDSDLEMSPLKPGKQRRAKERGKKKAKKSDGWIWLESLTRGQRLGGDRKLAEYKKESDRVQWFRAEAEMYRWLEQYEHKHAELMRVIESSVGGRNGAATFARMQASMYMRLEHNARVIFKSADSGAHHDWVSANTFDELVSKIDGWRDVVFKWMDEMDIHRAYKDF
ncbi:CxC2 domain-containing protein [Mycena venus]|uniref:CxC2 domain-containing protein n=1 Tax=Mycena venus TaxID=2733690 RepID=A0A8H6XT49_9AGAR|nr:CxC2 domain-containing protein [Mycena venus]